MNSWEFGIRDRCDVMSMTQKIGVLAHSSWVLLLSGLLAHASGITQAEFDRFTSHYYEAPQPAQAPTMLRYLLSDILSEQSKWQGDPHTLHLMGYFFGRIGQGHPEVVRAYEGLFPAASEQGTLLLLDTFILCGDDTTKARLTAWMNDPQLKSYHEWIASTVEQMGSYAPDRLTREIASAWDLDQLWMEFFITGDERPVRRIVEVANREDRIRQRLNAWFEAHPAAADRETMGQRLVALALPYDWTTNETSPGIDLDLFFARVAGSREQILVEAFRELRSVLGISDDDVMHMAIKWAAAWALESNCEQHPKLAHLCH